jgi:hypothetical protein
LVVSKFLNLSSDIVSKRILLTLFVAKSTICGVNPISFSSLLGKSKISLDYKLVKRTITE